MAEWSRSASRPSAGLLEVQEVKAMKPLIEGGDIAKKLQDDSVETLRPVTGEDTHAVRLCAEQPGAVWTGDGRSTDAVSCAPDEKQKEKARSTWKGWRLERSFTGIQRGPRRSAAANPFARCLLYQMLRTNQRPHIGA